MNYNRKKVLNIGDTIILKSKNRNNISYEIESIYRYTPDAVTYLADRWINNDIEKGYLVEFYPEYFDLKKEDGSSLVGCERDEELRLVSTKSMDYFNQKVDGFFAEVKERIGYLGDCSGNGCLQEMISRIEVLYFDEEDAECERESAFFKSFNRIFDKKKKEDEASRPTMYVWIKKSKCLNLKQYITMLHSEDEINEYDKLQEIFQIFEILIECVCELHKNNLRFSGIDMEDVFIDGNYGKEEKHLYLSSLNMILGQNDSVIHQMEAYKPNEKIVTKQTDMFAIGTMLFWALTKNDSLVEGIKSDEGGMLSMFIEDSSIISGAEGFSKPYFKYRIVRFFENCLAYQDYNRFSNFEEFKEKYKEVYKLLDTFSESSVKGNRQEFLSPNVAIQRLLYERPLYEHIMKDSQHIHVLVIGGGSYSQMFIDQSLQSAQMPGWSIRIDVLSKQAVLDKESYLHFRPALNEYVRIDGEYDRERDDEYAELNFSYLDESREKQFMSGDSQWNNELVQEIVNRDEFDDISTIFIALGDDQLNSMVAESFEQVVNASCYINYAVDYKKNISKENCSEKRVYAVCMKEKQYSEEIEGYLDHMAFNTHLSWFNSLNVDFNELRKEFRHNRYSLISSTAFALSIKYKLHSVNCALEKYDSFEEAANAFSENVLKRAKYDETAKRNYEELIAAEHRRWVLEKILTGWTTLRDENGNIDYNRCLEIGGAKDEKNRRHACILHGTSELKLQKEIYTKNKKEKWNCESDIDKELDELDAFSVNFHRMFYKEAKKIQESQPFEKGLFVILKNQIPMDDGDIHLAYERYLFYLKNLFHGSKSYASQYKHYENEFLKALDKLPENEYTDVKRTVKRIRELFAPVVSSAYYRDYKQNDEILINKIPFIMTFRPITTLAQVFVNPDKSAGGNHFLFSNVAAATVLNPQKLLYLYYYNAVEKENYFIDSVKRVLNYFEKRGSRCQIDFRIVYDDLLHKNKVQSLYEKLSVIKNNYTGFEKSEKKNQTRVRADFKLERCCSEQEVMKKLILPMTRKMSGKNSLIYNGSSQLFESEKNDSNTKYTMLIWESGIPYFEYSTKNNGKFEPKNSCDFLKYINNTAYITVEDIFSLAGAVATGYMLPEFADDYSVLWNIYCGSYFNDSDENIRIQKGGKTWNKLCDIFETNGTTEKDVLVSIEEELVKKRFSHAYYAPLYTYKTYQQIIKDLTKSNWITDESHVRKYTLESCEIKIVSEYNLQDVMDRIMSYQQYYIDENNVSAKATVLKKGDYSRERKTVDIMYDSLYGAVFKSNMDKNVENLIQELEKKGYIRRYKTLPQDSDKARGVSADNATIFVFGSKRIKDLLTNAGKLFEIYTYYEVVKTGYFDDVVSSYEFNWRGERNSKKNELDLVVTKGFCSLILELKSVYKLNANYYTKLDSLVTKFGINAQRVLVANLYAGNGDEEVNRVNMEGGEAMDIITIQSHEDIKNIGQKVVEIMEGKCDAR